MPLYQPELLFCSTSEQSFLSHQVVETDDAGVIVQVAPADHFTSHRTSIQQISGLMIPGMINAHCHLELSHMKGMIPTGNRLTTFIKHFITKRHQTPESILAAVKAGDQEMYAHGIVAVGDISNVTDSFETKENSQLRYHTFVETYDLMQSKTAPAEMEKSLSIFHQLQCPTGHKKSIVPHAPYSVSNELFALIKKQADFSTSTSIHHEETEAEIQFIESKSGELADFFLGFGLNFDQFSSTGIRPSQRVVHHMSDRQTTLLVHNTMSTKEDFKLIENWNPSVYWVTCPNANLYIENRLPNYIEWMETKAKVCLGTDSLASNWQLSILSEMQTIQRYQSDVPSHLLILWATIHGAQALGFDHEIGSIEQGKKPGLVQITGFDVDHLCFTPQAQAHRIV